MTGPVAFDGWTANVEDAVDVVTPAAAGALHDLLDLPGDAPSAGAPLPPLWHWLAFRPRSPQRLLGPDGHPPRGGFLPPVRLPRRMAAGFRVELARAPRVGEPLHRRATVVSVEAKTGRSGELVFVTTRAELRTTPHDGATPLLVEEQDLVYRGVVPPSGPPAAPGPGVAPDDPSPDGWPWARDLAVDPRLLFRFSALTYNAHRIHYDRDYARDVEGYPGLVVHGPLQALALAELCRAYIPNRAVRSFRSRAVAPAFDDGPVLLRGRELDGNRAELVAFGHRGTPTTRADADLEPA